MIAELKQIITNAGISFNTTYEEANFYNAVNTDEYPYNTYQILIEEFLTGNIDRVNGNLQETMKAQVYAFYIPQGTSTNDTTAEKREDIREYIKREAIYKLANQLRYDRTNQTKAFTISYPVSRFDCEEIGVLLEFDWKQTICPNNFS
jgi:hypothetical protein